MSRPEVVMAERARMAAAARIEVAGLVVLLPHVPAAAAAVVPQPDNTSVRGGQAPGGGGAGEAAGLLVALAAAGEGEVLVLVEAEGETETVGLFRTRKDTVTGYAS
jgi:hypothetical protein